MLSHLLQMRGLKQKLSDLSYNPFHVASFTDAWIETFKKTVKISVNDVASFTDAWIETLLVDESTNECWSRIFYRCVD